MKYWPRILDTIQKIIIRKINYRTVVVLHDLIMVAVAWLLAWLVRFNLEIPYPGWERSIYILPNILALQAVIFWRYKLYRGRWRFASLPDLWNIIKASLLGALCITLIMVIMYRLVGIPRSILIMYPIFLIFLLGGSRLGYRLWQEHFYSLKQTLLTGTRVLVIGGGSAGEMLVRDMIRDRNYLPIGIIDDNPKLKRSEIHGIRILGSIDRLKELVEQCMPNIIVIAIPSASSKQMQRIVNACEETAIPMRTLPKLSEMVTGGTSLNEIRDVSIEDLLGRETVNLEWDIIRTGISGKIVLVTGGGGSIGSELCRQIIQLNPLKLIIFEQGEFNLYKIQHELSRSTDIVEIIPVLGDVCDVLKVNTVFEKFTPDFIFHAAAYKHVPILEEEIREAVKNNILGTACLADAAGKFQCNKFIFISTDKAVNPSNVLGMSKRVAELICEYKNNKFNTQFITVRFGNVLGSDGSVVPLFQKQIKSGGPVTVTHPEVTRYFMTIKEASQLILQACVIGIGGEIFVLDMGKPVKITYLAEQMIRLSGAIPGKDISIEFTGLRAGEKLHEELFYDNEIIEPTLHNKISLVNHIDINFDSIAYILAELEKACNTFDEERLSKLLREIIPGKDTTTDLTSNVISIS